MGTPQSAAEREVSNLYSDREGRVGVGQRRLMTYWCYQCNKLVMVQVEEGASLGVAGEDTVCPDCRTGFIEIMRTNRAFPDGRPAQRQLTEENDDLYQQHDISQLLQGLAAVRGDVPGRSAEERRNSRAQMHNSGLVEEQFPDVTEDAIARDGSLSQEEEADFEDEGGISEAEERREFVDWGVTDVEYEEWEEVEDGAEDAAWELDGQPRENDDQPGGRESTQQVVDGEYDEQSRIGNTSRNRARRGNIRSFLEHLRYRQPRVSALRLEIPETDTYYIGNPGDYLDARGYEQFLQQLLENDTSRRGAPPASKLAVEALLSITIQQKHLNDGSAALCVICKDAIASEEHAKQMPCLHLYHNDCILQWLSCRNSCPVCRYELPTDDTDYEEQKARNHWPQRIPQEGSSYQDDAGVNRGLSIHQEEDNEQVDNVETGNRQSDYSEEGDILDSMHRDGTKNATD